MNKLRSVVLAALLVTGSAMANVDQKGFYVGGALNQVNASGYGRGTSDGTGIGVYGGYNFNHWFALEANLFTSGNLRAEDADVSASALTFTPKFTYHFNDTVSAYAKVGVASMGLVMDYGSFEQDYSGVGLTWGVGVNAALTNKLHLRLSYDRTNGDLDGDSYWYDGDYYREINRVGISQLAVGLHYQF